MKATVDDVLEALLQSGKFSGLVENFEGANARAFRAVNENLQREVFLKVYDYLDDARNEMLHEPRILVAATTNPGSPHLVQIYEADILAVKSDKVLCLQMELVSGPSLLKVIESGTLGVQDAVRIASGITGGVLHLQSKNILHRDLKPSNLLLDGGIARITDFGSARVLAAGATAVPASKHSALYVPPEGFDTPSKYSMRSDVYQIGMVLYELVNGPLVYDGDHYVLPAQRKALEKAGTPFASLDGFERSSAQDAGIASLARKGALLSHGRAAAQYMPKSVSRIIRAATEPNEAKRIDAAELQRRLARVNTPNWKNGAPNELRCAEWANWDWRVVSGPKGTEVARSKPGTDCFRKHNAIGGLSSLSSILAAIEDFAD